MRTRQKRKNGSYLLCGRKAPKNPQRRKHRLRLRKAKEYLAKMKKETEALAARLQAENPDIDIFTQEGP